jgi:HlyD family secretion protein
MHSHDDVLVHPHRTPPRDVGPQGAALILELQRLREALERDKWGEMEAPPPRRASLREDPLAGQQRRRAPKRPPRRRMGRIIDVCLGHLGLNAGTTAPSLQTATAKAAPRPRKRASVTQVAPVAMDLSGAAPEMTIADPAKDAPRALGTPLNRQLQQLIRPCRRFAAFLMSPDQPARPGDTLASVTGRHFVRELKIGMRVLIATGVLAGGWAALVPLAGAVVVPGNLVVQSNVKAIQHPTGGVVAEIPVRNGMVVKAGDLLLRLDATQAQASLQVVAKQLDEFRARSARLVAERDGLARPDLPDELAPRIGEPAVKGLLTAEATLFQARATARDSQKALLRSRMAQLNEEIAGLEAQVASKARQIELIGSELAGVQDLYDKRLVPLPRLTALQRESARIEGERGQLISAIAETRAKISEAQLQTVRIDQDFRTDVVKELGEVKGKVAELVERSVAARDLLDRIELRAPVSGLIHQLNVHTVGGVIRAGDTVMEVVPDADDLQIEARLPPADIDQVRIGQKAFTRFPAFNQRVTPELAGVVSYVSADIARDPQSNAGFFTVRVTLPDEERRRLAGLQLVSGMPAEIFMQTGSRTMLSYLFKPITDQLARAFVER